MKKKEVFLLLDELLEVSPGTSKGNESIDDWDSIVIIGLIALADEQFGRSLSAEQINSARTADDIVNLLIN